MQFTTKELFFSKMDQLSEKKTPFFFITDFLNQHSEILLLSDLSKNGIFFTVDNNSNFTASEEVSKVLHWEKFPMPESEYRQQFKQAQQAIHAGNTYLINLTCSSPVETNYTLKEIFQAGKSKYKLFYKAIFTHFSPEPFVKIINNRIYSFPMKGTIDAGLPDAEQQILSDTKELNEQYTIVDLIRNDLSIVADNVKVDQFRYIEKIITNQKELLAVSSKVSGDIKADFRNKTGKIFSKILPAGSICGAPKAKTVELINQIENHERGWYTGVWGIFDGQNTDSCVIIRYIEKTADGLVFKSGGGITSMSEAETEFQEMMDKVYLPIYSKND